ncbi:hypothetical protein [Arthrobacter sp. Rue61a]|uniref:hypothetical protein n=1 Tax=Arthrobacter sp. Rue61a TaxID=1118963 RepID=UPI00027DF25F|nr:hypothetical protein [Arthrobacter sp. Rue61a]AFR31146.1 hypothetical protein ARUE_c42740 [Arthrobacter sp. Rue61a]
MIPALNLDESSIEGQYSREASIFAGVLSPSSVPEMDRTFSPARSRKDSKG